MQNSAAILFVFVSTLLLANSLCALPSVEPVESLSSAYCRYEKMVSRARDVNPRGEGEPTAKPRPEIPPETRRLISVILRVTGGFLGGTLAGACLLALALQRRETSAGIAALAGSVVLGAVFGTLATLIPAAFLFLYLRRRNLMHPPELAPPSGWMVLLWVVVLAGLSFVLQFGATILATVPVLMELGSSNSDDVVRVLMRDGTMLRLIMAAGWISFLGLLIACGPHDRVGWRRLLGLHRCKLGSAALWMFGAGVILAGLQFMTEQFMDERSRTSLELIAEGEHSPFWFFLVLVFAIPVGEELLFRGYAFAGWIDKIGAWGAILAPSILFTICHVQYGWTGLLYIFAMGLALGLLRWKTGSIYPCIVLHVLNNLIYCVEAY